MNEIIIAELYLNDSKDTWILQHPFILEIDNNVTASPFLPGSDQTTFSVLPTYIITYAMPDEFITKFYGSMLFRSATQKLLEREPFTGKKEDLQEYLDVKLYEIKNEIMNKFGMMGSDFGDANVTRLLH